VPTELDVRLGEMQPQILARRIAQPVLVRLGLSISDSAFPVRVYRVWDGFPAAIAGLGVGDQILAINNIPVENRDQFFVLLADQGLLTGETVVLSVQSPGDETPRQTNLTLYP